MQMAPAGRRPGETRSWVYEALRRQIMTGHLAPGAPLVASRLARAVGASRTPVREALVRLLTDGLAAEGPAGLAVTRLTEDEILEIYEVRIPLEALAARLAAASLAPRHLAQIEAAHDKFAAAARAAEPDAGWLAAANLELHRAICQAARNALLAEFLSRIHDAVGRFRGTTLQRPGRLAEAVAEHEALVAAIAARDADRAETVARRHMTRALEARLRMYREGLEAGPGPPPGPL
jgi:DNA-binding GntR family transcriptional regulator